MKNFAMLMPMLLGQLCCQINYVLNGDFQDPVISQPFLNICPTNWRCNKTQLVGKNFSLGHMYGQFMDMDWSSMGALTQQILLPEDGNCTLSYYLSRMSDFSKSYNLTVFWNGQLIDYQPSLGATTILHKEFIVSAVKGNNELKFWDQGISDDSGALIDNVSVTCNFKNAVSNQTTEQNNSSEINIFSSEVVVGFSTVLLFPITSVSCLQSFFILLEDLWMHHYDHRNYTGKVNDVFNTVDQIQTMKFQLIGKYFDLTRVKEFFSFEKYLKFTEPNFQEHSQTSYVILDVNMSYFFFNIPESIIICGLLCFLYRKTKRKCSLINSQVRIYGYMKSVTIQTLIQGNIVYFVYLCFGHLERSFSFNFFGKISLAFTVFFFFLVVIFSVAFPSLIWRYLANGRRLFTDGFRNVFMTNYFITCRNYVRSFARGVIIYQLRHHYEWEVGVLGLLEFFIVCQASRTQKSRRIFSSRMKFGLTILYHALLGILYFIFLLESIGERESMTDLNIICQKMQEYIIYGLVGVSVFSFVFDIAKILVIKIKKYMKQKNISDARVKETKNNEIAHENALTDRAAKNKQKRLAELKKRHQEKFAPKQLQKISSINSRFVREEKKCKQILVISNSSFVTKYKFRENVETFQLSSVAGRNKNSRNR